MAYFRPDGTKIGPNDVCYCGKKKKYKFCCRNKDRSVVPEISKSHIAAADRIFSDARKRVHCCHPDSPKSCSDKLIRAHTISKGLGLTAIEEDHHVLGFRTGNIFEMIKNDGKFLLSKFPTTQASTFKGFCHKHDNELFSEIEDCNFTGNQRQVALLMFRSLCKEIRAKESAAHLPDAIQKMIPAPSNNSIQAKNYWEDKHAYATLMGISVLMGIMDLHKSRKEIESFLFQGSDSTVQGRIYEYDTLLPYSTSSMCSPRYTFSGKHVQNLGDLNADIATIFCHIIHSIDNRSKLVISWERRSYDTLMDFINELDEAFLNGSASAPLEFIVSYFENVFFKPSWFQGLSCDQKLLIEQWFDRHLTESDTIEYQHYPLSFSEFPLPLPTNAFDSSP